MIVLSFWLAPIIYPSIYLSVYLIFIMCCYQHHCRCLDDNTTGLCANEDGEWREGKKKIDSKTILDNIAIAIVAPNHITCSVQQQQQQYRTLHENIAST